jgi:hypothetical protein
MFSLYFNSPKTQAISQWKKFVKRVPNILQPIASISLLVESKLRSAKLDQLIQQLGSLMLGCFAGS